MRFIPFLLAVLIPAPATGQEKRLNVLFIAVDDLNDWTCCLGKRPDAKTPNMDKLAARGTLFTRAYCPAPACNPSRAAILTGKRPSTSGVYHNNQPWRPVMMDQATLLQYFTRHGYLVAGGGKIFHGGFNDPASWERTIKAPGGNPVPAKRPANGIVGGANFDWGPVEETDEAMADHKLISAAGEFFKEKHEKPFFLAVGLTRPHLPFYAPKKYFDLYPLDKLALPRTLENDLDDVPPAGVKMAKPDGDHKKVLAAKQWKEAVQAYLACISFADHQVGRLLEAIAASPYAENTIIILWGDHGWHLGEKSHWRKFALWEEATRTTLIVASPGAPAGNRCGRTVNLMDMHPTLIELCGLPARKDIEAHSFAPLLRDPKGKWEHAALTTHGKGNHAVRTERWRYIRYADGGEELYDHDADPLEWKNLARDPRFAMQREEMARLLPALNAADAPAVKDGAKKKKKAK